MFIAALLIVAKIWKKPKCPPVDKWINKMWYTHNRVLYSYKKKGCNLVTGDNMDGPKGYYAK